MPALKEREQSWTQEKVRESPFGKGISDGVYKYFGIVRKWCEKSSELHHSRGKSR